MAGKGLESLIPKKIQRNAVPTVKEEAIFYIETEKINSNPYQPRKHFDEKALASLSQSIQDYGILQPLVVSKIEKQTPGGQKVEYQLIAGERRLLASKIAGFTQVPVIIRQTDSKQKLELSLIENVQRLDLDPIDKATAFKKLQQEFNFSRKDVSRLCGKSKESVSNTLRLLNLPEEIQQELKLGKITEAHAKAILSVKDEKKQKIICSKIIKDGLNVRETDILIQKLNICKPSSRPTILPSIDKDVQEFQEQLKKISGVARLSLKIELGRPKLAMMFNSKKEFRVFLNKVLKK